MKRMFDRKTVMSWLEGLTQDDYQTFHSDSEVQQIAMAALELLKEQEELLRKLQKDKDKLCLDVSEWKHKFYDRSLKEQEAVEPKKEDDGTPEPWTMWWYACGDCGQPIDKMDRYCRRCGQKVKWE